MTPEDVKKLNRITIVFKDGEVRTYQPGDDWEDYRVFKHYFAVINKGGAWIGMKFDLSRWMLSNQKIQNFWSKNAKIKKFRIFD